MTTPRSERNGKAQSPCVPPRHVSVLLALGAILSPLLGGCDHAAKPDTRPDRPVPATVVTTKKMHATSRTPSPSSTHRTGRAQRRLDAALCLALGMGRIDGVAPSLPSPPSQRYRPRGAPPLPPLPPQKPFKPFALTPAQSKAASDLLTRGADINALDAGGSPLLVRAFHQGNDPAFRFLLNHGVNLGRNGSYPYNVGPDCLCEAVMVVDGEDWILPLLQHDVDVNDQSMNGRSALMYTAMMDRRTMAPFLLAHGARTDLRNKDGKTAEDLALRGGANDVATLLKESKK